MNELKTLQDLKDLVNNLENNFKGYNLNEVKIVLSDRFNEYQLSKDYAVYEGTAILQCYPSGSALKGTHRVLGGEE